MDQVQIFISYAREDQERVKQFYHRLVEAGFHPWLDREHILPGMKWEPIIKAALKRSGFALVCLSATSINKRGFLQKEIKQALEQAEEKLEDDIWLTDNQPRPDDVLRDGFQYRNLGPFRVGGWISDIAAPQTPLKAHLYTFYVAARHGGNDSLSPLGHQSDIKDANPWAQSAMDKIVADFTATTERYPHVPPNAPDPYAAPQRK